MKLSTAPQALPGVEPPPARLGRRGLLVGAGAAGVAAVAATALRNGAIADAAAVAAAPAVAGAEGYRLTPHILRYYETTKA